MAQPPATGGGNAGGTTAPYQVTFRSGGYRYLVLANDGTSYAYSLDDGPGRIYASADGRSWTARGVHPAGNDFFVVAALHTGTLLADTIGANGHVVSRSTDGGRTWTDVLPLGQYRLLTPRSVAELGGEVFLVEYQAFTGNSVPIRLWASGDDGATWTVRYLTSAHRHGHGLLADPAKHALWIFYGDLAGGTYLSYDQGHTMTLVRGPLDGGVLVQAVATPGGLLAGQDGVFQNVPNVVSLSFAGAYDARFQLPGPSYSIMNVAGGGYLVGTAHEPVGDVYPAGDVSAHVFASPDGQSFREVFACARLSTTDAARADVAGQLATGEEVVAIVNCGGFGPNGMGYVLLAPP